jgi:hypothetical protein
MNSKTACVHGARLFEPVDGAASVPTHHTAPFRRPDRLDQPRSERPARNAPEQTAALLEPGKEALS